MYELKTNTAVRIPAGPFVQHGDGKTANTTLDVTQLSVQMYRIDTTGGAVVRTQFTPPNSGNNDMALVTGSTDGTFDLELTAAQLNWLGCGEINFYDVDEFLVHWIPISVVSENYFNFKYGSTAYTVDLTSAALAAVADKQLGRNIMGGSDGGRTVSEAFCGVRNKHGIDSVDGKYKVYETDDSTLSWEATVTASQSAAPVTEINPD